MMLWLERLVSVNLDLFPAAERRRLDLLVDPIYYFHSNVLPGRYR